MLGLLKGALKGLVLGFELSRSGFDIGALLGLLKGALNGFKLGLLIDANGLELGS